MIITIADWLAVPATMGGRRGMTEPSEIRAGLDKLSFRLHPGGIGISE